MATFTILLIIMDIFIICNNCFLYYGNKDFYLNFSSSRGDFLSAGD